MKFCFQIPWDYPSPKKKLFLIMNVILGMVRKQEIFCGLYCQSSTLWPTKNLPVVKIRNKGRKYWFLSTSSKKWQQRCKWHGWDLLITAVMRGKIHGEDRHWILCFLQLESSALLQVSLAWILDSRKLSWKKLHLNWQISMKNLQCWSIRTFSWSK